ncbi:unnamed protein product [Camellia sinensis]
MGWIKHGLFVVGLLRLREGEEDGLDQTRPLRRSSSAERERRRWVGANTGLDQTRLS